MKKKAQITREYLNYRGVISSILARLGYVSAPDIEDILQETYIRTYQAAIAREIKFPKAYMVKTALRLANSSLERRDKSTHGELNDALLNLDAVADELPGAIGAEPEELCIQMEEFELLCKAVNELPQQCRKVFVMKKIFGLSQREIAKSLSLSESTVEKHVAKGMLCCARFVKANQSNSVSNGTKGEAATTLGRS